MWSHRLQLSHRKYSPAVLLPTPPLDDDESMLGKNVVKLYLFVDTVSICMLRLVTLDEPLFNGLQTNAAYIKL